MESNDLSRVAFDPRKHYASVRMQQGRALTEDDWNENERIENEERRRSRVDIIGAAGSQDVGFAIEQARGVDGNLDFNICPGTFHLGGLRLELEKMEMYRKQKDWLQQPASERNLLQNLELGQERFDLIYLEAWQQSVSAVEDEELLEMALGGPDTSTRVRTMRRVKVLPNVGNLTCEGNWKTVLAQDRGVINDENELVSDTRLKVEFREEDASKDLCSPAVAGGYLGAENQAIRVQLTQNGFTWGFDNASPLYQVEIRDGVTVHFLTEPKDQRHWMLAGQVVEILPWSAVLPNGEKVAEQQGHLTKVALGRGYNPSSQNLTIASALPVDFVNDWHSGNTTLFYLRVWDRGEDLVSPTELIFGATPTPLIGTGLHISISGAHRVPGEYWVIAVRPKTPGELVPWQLKDGKAPNGVRRFYAPLAIVRWFHSSVRIRGKIVSDCRQYFPPLTNIRAKDVKFDHRGVCRFPDAQVKTVQDAIEALCQRQKCTIVAIPGEDWERVLYQIAPKQDAMVCFQTGTYHLKQAVTLENKGSLTFMGAGNGTRIIVEKTEAAFVFNNCTEVVIRDLSILSHSTGSRKSKKHLNGALTMLDCRSTSVEHVLIACSHAVKREAACITVRKSESSKLPNLVHIEHCRFFVGSNQVGILVVNADRAYVRTNHLSVRPPTSSSPILDSSAGSAIPPSQGIVLAGTSLDEVHVKDNSVHGFIQGIHVGTSHRESEKGEPDFAGVVQITGNQVETFQSQEYARERHGIFVGNCESLLVMDNFVRLFAANTKGIRLVGYFGRRLMVKHNHIIGNRGRNGDLLIQVLRRQQLIINKLPGWVEQHNVARVIKNF